MVSSQYGVAAGVAAATKTLAAVDVFKAIEAFPVGPA